MGQGELAAVLVRSGDRIAERVGVARGMLGRMRGLLGRRPLEPGEGLLLAPCNGIHTVGMRYPIDALFLDRRDRVTRAVHAMDPGRFIPFVRGSARCIELPAGTLARLQVREGDEVWLVAPCALR
jgi:uncharacterized protein